jgi:hypothetical protein
MWTGDSFIMADRPQVKPGEWIKVAHQDCVVTEVGEDEDSDGQCEVLFDPDEPRYGKAMWNGEEWVSPDTGGGYAEKSPHLGMSARKHQNGH